MKVAATRKTCDAYLAFHDPRWSEGAGLKRTCVHVFERGSIPGVHLCSVKMSSREAMQEIYHQLDALGLEGTLMTHVCPLQQGVARGEADWTDCPWYRPPEPDER